MACSECKFICFSVIPLNGFSGRNSFHISWKLRSFLITLKASRTQSNSEIKLLSSLCSISNFTQQPVFPPPQELSSKEILYQDYNTSCGRGASYRDFELPQHLGALGIWNIKFPLTSGSTHIGLPQNSITRRNGSNAGMRTQKSQARTGDRILHEGWTRKVAWPSSPVVLFAFPGRNHRPWGFWSSPGDEDDLAWKAQDALISSSPPVGEWGFQLWTTHSKYKLRGWSFKKWGCHR